jgi:hypothetical protein
MDDQQPQVGMHAPHRQPIPAGNIAREPGIPTPAEWAQAAERPAVADGGAGPHVPARAARDEAVVPEPAAAEPQDDFSDTDSIVYRKDDEPLTRFDLRHYDIIFRDGFRPWNNKRPAGLLSCQTITTRTAFVSTSRRNDYVPPAMSGKRRISISLSGQAARWHRPDRDTATQSFRRNAGGDLLEGNSPRVHQGVAIFEPASPGQPFRFVKTIRRSAWQKEIEEQGRTLYDGSWLGPGEAGLGAEANRRITRLMEQARRADRMGGIGDNVRRRGRCMIPFRPECRVGLSLEGTSRFGQGADAAQARSQ